MPAATSQRECPASVHVRQCQPLEAVAFGHHCDHFYRGGLCCACRDGNGSGADGGAG